MLLAQLLLAAILCVPAGAGAVHAAGISIPVLGWAGNRGNALSLDDFEVPPTGPSGPALEEALRDGGATIRLSDSPVLFVTHGAPVYDTAGTAKAPIDRAVRFFKSRGWPIVSLVACTELNGFEPYLEDRAATWEICSGLGRHSVKTGRAPIFVSGGFFAACSMETVQSAVLGAALSRVKSGSTDAVEVYYLSDAVYTHVLNSSLEDLLSTSPIKLPGRVLLSWKYFFRDLKEDADEVADGLSRRFALRIMRDGSILHEFAAEDPAHEITVRLHLTTTSRLK